MQKFDHPIGHFQVMEKVARFLKTLEIQLLVSEYHYETFGSWWFKFQKNGKTYQILYDGRDSRLSFESDPMPTNRHGMYMDEWTELDALIVYEMGDVDLDVLIERLLREGLSKATAV